MDQMIARCTFNMDESKALKNIDWKDNKSWVSQFTEIRIESVRQIFPNKWEYQEHLNKFGIFDNEKAIMMKKIVAPGDIIIPDFNKQYVQILENQICENGIVQKAFSFGFQPFFVVKNYDSFLNVHQFHKKLKKKYNIPELKPGYYIQHTH